MSQKQFYIPPVGFFYSLSLIDPERAAEQPSALDAGFQEVSGISATYETENIKEGGENRFNYIVPKGNVTYENLVLKRGLIVWGTTLSGWCHKHFQDGLNSLIQTKILCLKLLDARSKLPIMAWIFYDAYPIKWEVNGFNAESSQIVIESMTFSYNYFQMAQELRSNYKPQEKNK